MTTTTWAGGRAPAALDRFGNAISIGGGWAFVGACHDNDAGTDSGSAYVFALDDCALQICGDSVILGAEECDDGNTEAGDGCSPICMVESGWDCTGEPSTCTFHCGDGVMSASEECDDGNALSGDGCFVDCTVEIGWTCTGQPSACTELMAPQIRWNPVAASGNVFCTPDIPPCRRTEIMLLEGGVKATLFMQVSGWDWDQDDMPTLGAFQGTLDSSTLWGGHASGVNTLPGADLVPVGWPAWPYDEGAFQALMVCSDDFFDVDMTDPNIALSRCTRPDDCPPDYPFCVDRPDYVFYELHHYSQVWRDTADFAWLGLSLDCAADPDGGATKFYVGTLLLDVPIGAQGTYNVRMIDDPQTTMLLECWGISIEGLVVSSGQITIPSGRCCSGIGAGSTACEDGVYAAECDTRPGPRVFAPLEACSGPEVPDCNGNGIPDECDVIAGDCNANGAPDECDVDSGGSEDCNDSGTPDECEPDSDGDGAIDECDGCPFDPNKIEPGRCGCGVDDHADSDGDGVPDCSDECAGVDDDLFGPSCKAAIPTLSEWGLVVMTLLLLTAGKLYFGRRRVTGHPGR
ncbi:MAG: IPTL-CTERM sorting domain-containing protein [Planctomycetota bacterium]